VVFRDIRGSLWHCADVNIVTDTWRPTFNLTPLSKPLTASNRISKSRFGVRPFPKVEPLAQIALRSGLLERFRLGLAGHNAIFLKPP
jgi:hypothetical protein